MYTWTNVDSRHEPVFTPDYWHPSHDPSVIPEKMCRICWQKLSFKMLFQINSAKGPRFEIKLTNISHICHNGWYDQEGFGKHCHSSTILLTTRTGMWQFSGDCRWTAATGWSHYSPIASQRRTSTAIIVSWTRCWIFSHWKYAENRNLRQNNRDEDPHLIKGKVKSLI